MNVENQTLETTWKEVIVHFFEHKVSQSNLYKARDYIEKKEKEIKTETNERKLIGLQKAKEKKEKEQIQLRFDSPSSEIRQWMDKTCQTKIAQGKRIIKATHVLKFSHGSSEAMGLCLEEKTEDALLTTASLKKTLTYDLAHNNGALITISRFLALKLSNALIIDLILKNDFSFLEPFAKDSMQLNEWKEGFASLVEEREIKTGEKTKQIYFPKKTNPVSDREHYDLLIPLFSSSLAEEIYSWVTDIKFGEEQKKITASKKPPGSDIKASKYHHGNAVTIPDLGVIKFGGAQPQNISMLNKDRGGRSFLFSTQPPTWQSQLQPPVNRQSLFSDLYNATIKTELEYLRDFLLRFNRLDLSIKDPKRKRHLERWVNNIIDEFLFYVASIQNLPSGWSGTEKIRLKKEHQYLLDPYHSDVAFQSARQATDWQAIIRADFALWLNRQLTGKDKQFTPKPEHTRLWKKLLAQPLREYMALIELEIKQQVKEVV